jgi:transposase
VADDKTHRATWDLLCRLTGRRDFLYVADCKLATRENMAHIHQHQGRFLTVLPRTRSEDRAFQELLRSGQVQWRPIHDKRNDQGEVVDQYSVSVPTTLSEEGYRLVWYHSTLKAQCDAQARHQQVERALIELAELRLKLSSRGCRLQLRRVPLWETSEDRLSGCGVMRSMTMEEIL